MKRRGDGHHRTLDCPYCAKNMRSDMLKAHIATHNITIACRYCKKQIRMDKLIRHETLCQDQIDDSLCTRSDVQELPPDPKCCAVSGCFKSYELQIPGEITDFDTIISNVSEAAKALLSQILKEQSIKSQVLLSLSFYRHNEEENEVVSRTFRSICEPLLIGDPIDSYLGRVKAYIRKAIEEYERFGSGWLFDKFHSAHVEVAKYRPLSGSGTVNIPDNIKKMRSVLNILSKDNRCFLYCILAKLYPVKEHPYRHTQYLAHIDKVKLGDVTFPVKITDISKIEDLNKISISVFEWNLDENCVIPLKHGSRIGTQIDLLYIKDNDTAHYLLIKDFEAFMRHKSKHHNSMFHCRKCLHGFTKKDSIEEHAARCKQGINQVVSMPSPGFIEFKAHHKQEKKLFVLYFDFESLVIPIQGCDRDPNPSDNPKKKVKKSYTESYQKHIPCSFSIVTKSEFADYKEETIVFCHEDPDTVIHTFIEELARIHSNMMKCYKNNQHPIDMSEEDEEAFLSATQCHICKKALDWEKKHNYPVRDHDHTQRKDNYHGATNNSCNINYFERTKKVPAFCHNLKGYDINLFLLDLAKSLETIDVIPENIEKFKVIITDDFIFLDSFAFMSTSMEKLVDNLKSRGLDSFSRMKKEFPENYDILAAKGVYFYDYASSFSVFAEIKLPTKAAFYSIKDQKHISDKDYKRAQYVYQRTECNSLLDYMLLYVKTDAVLLCDVFENFRSLCMEYYNLDPCHFFSLPAFSWEAMLRMTGVQLEYITDIDMYTFIEKNLRGGVTTINHRQFTANNKYLDDYREDLPSSYIHYVDANNLYGAGMSAKLPTGNFRWLEREEVNEFSPMDVDPDGDLCYILEVDLEYPSAIHDLHNDYPLAVECKMIEEEDLSPYNRQFLSDHKEKFVSSKKLCPDLKDKQNYVCSLKNLQLFINHGLVLKKIHKVLVADQSDFLRSYIEFNSSKRLKATSKFESDFFKLCNNAIYGKTIEDLRKRSNVDIVKDPKKAKKLISKPQLKGFHILDEDVTVVQSIKSKIELNKPIACGFMVLDNAKHIMGSFWYGILKPKYGDNIKLILSDTDSFVYAVYTDDGYKDLFDLRHYMDLSGYEKDTPLGQYYDPVNKKIPGKFSDERALEIIKEVIALKSKMYSVLTKKLKCDNIKKDPNHTCCDCCFVGHSATAKGVPMSAKKLIQHEEYRKVLETHGTTQITARSIRSFGHKLYTIKIRKRGLSSFDDKKYISDDGVNMLSYGHCRLK